VDTRSRPKKSWSRRLREWRGEVVSELDLTPYEGVLREIERAGADLRSVSQDDLRRSAEALRSKARDGVVLDELLPEAFALAREVSDRVLGLRPYDVQMIAAIALHQGKLAQMQTGEGKTLAAVMPVFLNGMTGAGVHVLTFNDYLARRDASWMGPVYRFLGMTVGTIQSGMSGEERRAAYIADVTYATAKEAGFDFLRDGLCRDPRELVHRPFNFAVVDEADSILIDEARVPLVIAGQRPLLRRGPLPSRRGGRRAGRR
jgi:preprotein translocase subunit SecA